MIIQHSEFLYFIGGKVQYVLKLQVWRFNPLVMIYLKIAKCYCLSKYEQISIV